MASKRFYLARRNPSTAVEGFPRLWRSHAAFVSQFGEVGGRFTRVLQCSRVLEGGVSGASSAYDGVAVLTCPSMEDALVVLPPDIRKKVDTDELRVFAGLVDGFSMLAEEQVIWDRGFDAARERAAVITFMKARSGVNRDVLCNDWRERGAPALAGVPPIAQRATRCVLNGIVGQPPAGYEFDAVTELWFDSAADAVAAYADPAVSGAPGPAQNDLIDPARTVIMFTRVTHSWTAPSR